MIAERVLLAVLAHPDDESFESAARWRCMLNRELPCIWCVRRAAKPVTSKRK